MNGQRCTMRLNPDAVDEGVCIQLSRRSGPFPISVARSQFAFVIYCFALFIDRDKDNR